MVMQFSHQAAIGNQMLPSDHKLPMTWLPFPVAGTSKFQEPSGYKWQIIIIIIDMIVMREI